MKPRTQTIRSVRDIPQFGSEDEERDWWETHDLSEHLYDDLGEAPKAIDAVLRGDGEIDGVVQVVVPGLPPVYGAALSIFSPKHPHARRVATLRRKAEQVMRSRAPIDEPVVLAVSQVYSRHGMADAANIIGAISNALEGIVYENDALIREAHFRSSEGERTRYVVRVKPLH